MARKAMVLKQQKLDKMRKKYIALCRKCKEEGKPVPKVKWYKPAKYYNRCKITGRPRAYMREFGVDRVTFRFFARAGKIMGVKKSSR